MRFSTVGLSSLLFLAGCAGPTFYDNYASGDPLRDFPYKVGVTGAMLSNDITDCQIEGAQRVPQQLASHTSPTYQTPNQTTCNRIGTQTFCNTIGGQTYGGRTTVFDANAELRSRATRQCMAKKGYRFLDVPACPFGTRPESLTVKQNGGLLPIATNTCYLAEPSGSWMIGNRS